MRAFIPAPLVATFAACGSRTELGVPSGGALADAGAVDSGTSPPANVPHAPRPIAPLSTATVTSQTPTLHWVLASDTDGARVDICRDRACTVIVTTFTASGTSGRPSAPLSAGVYFWRLHGKANGAVGTDTGPVWQFWVGARSAPTDVSWGAVPDVNGDGFADVLMGAQRADGVSGAVAVYLGGADGLAATPASTLTAAGDNLAIFTTPFANAGDVNGDGFDDVVLAAAPHPGTSAQDATTRLYLYLGGPQGPGPAPATTVVLPAAIAEVGPSVAAAGDVNGDGYADVLAATSCGSCGTVQLFLGGPTGSPRCLWRPSKYLSISRRCTVASRSPASVM
jgi:hypothetical protein